MTKSFLAAMAREYGFTVMGEWFCAWPEKDDTAFRALATLEDYLKP